MSDTTTADTGRRLTGCPWPTGIHRFVNGTCTRCGADDLAVMSGAPAGFTDADDRPVPYVPAEWADAARWTPPEADDANRESRVVAQVAVEYIVNHQGDGFDPETVRIVLDQAVAVGVAPFYTDMLAEVSRSDDETHHPETGEPHQFHDGCSCFPGCPAWDSKR